ncbi:hypothetical protein BC834DRAFT_909687, partial [Gloeopeniophorella convolvens]
MLRIAWPIYTPPLPTRVTHPMQSRGIRTALRRVLRQVVRAVWVSSRILRRISAPRLWQPPPDKPCPRHTGPSGVTAVRDMGHPNLFYLPYCSGAFMRYWALALDIGCLRGWHLRGRAHTNIPRLVRTGGAGTWVAHCHLNAGGRVQQGYAYAPVRHALASQLRLTAEPNLTTVTR